MKRADPKMRERLNAYHQQSQVAVQGIRSSLEKVSSRFEHLKVDSLVDRSKLSDHSDRKSPDAWSPKRDSERNKHSFENAHFQSETESLNELEEEKIDELMSFFVGTDSQEVFILDWRLISQVPGRKQLLKKAISNRFVDQIIKNKTAVTARIRHHLIQHQQHLNAIEDWSHHIEMLKKLNFDLEGEQFERKARNHLKIARLHKLECMDYIRKLSSKKIPQSEINEVFRLLDLVGGLYAKKASIVSFDVAEDALIEPQISA